MDALHNIVTREEIDKTLTINTLAAYLMFLKKKRTGKIKAQDCAADRPQRDQIHRKNKNPAHQHYLYIN